MLSWNVIVKARANANEIIFWKVNMAAQRPFPWLFNYTIVWNHELVFCSDEVHNEYLCNYVTFKSDFGHYFVFLLFWCLTYFPHTAILVRFSALCLIKQRRMIINTNVIYSNYCITLQGMHGFRWWYDCFIYN